MSTTFTPAEKARIRYHMGYSGTAPVETFALGVPTAIETQFLIEGAMNRVMPESEPEVRRIVGYLDQIEGMMVGDLELLAVTKVGEIEVNPAEQEKLRIQYRKWQQALGNILTVPANPFDQRYLSSGCNAPVQH